MANSAGLQIVMGSASELEYHLLLSKDLDYLAQKDYESLRSKVAEVKKMLSHLINSLRAKDRTLTIDRLTD